MKLYTENFTILLNKHITNKEIDTYEFRVMCYLLMLSDNDGTCYPSYKTIADRIDISETKAKDSIKNLIDLGLIKKEKRKKADGSASSNLYVVCEKTTVKVDEAIDDTTPCVQDDLPGSVQEEQGCESDGYNKYSNINNNYFINNHLSSIEDVMKRAETYELEGITKKITKLQLKLCLIQNQFQSAVKPFLVKLFVNGWKISATSISSMSITICRGKLLMAELKFKSGVLFPIS